MMMPANFTAVNSEVVYGGGVLEIIGDRTPDVWTAKNVKKFNTNILTILSNTFTPALVGSTLGTMFGGKWLDKDYEDEEGYKMFDKANGSFSGLYYKNEDDKLTFLNGTMRTIGLLASAYTLGTTDVKNSISENEVTIFGF